MGPVKHGLDYLCISLQDRKINALNAVFESLLPLPPSRSSSSTPSHTMPKPTTLSIELCEHIIDILTQDIDPHDRRQTLAACALTCRSWVRRSRLHLYSLGFVDTRQIKAFIASVTLNPSNGRFVRHLYLRGNDNRPEDQIDLILVPVQLPHKLPNLVHITFCDINLSVLHSSFFAHLRRFGKVRYITCDHTASSSLHRIAQLVRSFPRLERFHSERWRQADVKSLSPTPLTNSRIYHKVRIPHLVWLHLSGEEHVLGLFSPSAIVSLNIDYDVGGDHYDSVLLLLRECKDTLRHLTLWVKGPRRDKDPSAS